MARLPRVVFFISWFWKRTAPVQSKQASKTIRELGHRRAPKGSSAPGSAHPDLPGAVTLDQLEVLAQVVVGAKAHLEDLDGPAVAGDGQGLCGARLGGALSRAGHLPGQSVAGHHLVHVHGRVGLISS